MILLSCNHIKRILITLFAILASVNYAYACNVCGGGTNDVVVLALDGKVLFNVSFLYDNYLGVWDQTGRWRPAAYNQSQEKTTIAVAYRLNSHMQFSVSMPYVFNNSSVPGLKSSSNGFGDISINGRYEFFHEFQLRKKAGKTKMDNVLPYLALTFGLTLPTGRSDENALSEIDVTGKGFYTASVGISLIKSMIKNRLQLSTDLSWQHSFEKTYKKYFSQDLANPYAKQQGDKINYSASLNYILNSEHALAISIMGYSQTAYAINSVSYDNSLERNLSFAAAYTYYPTLQLRITPSVKWILTGDNLGRNSIGSTTFMLSVTYYIPEKLTK
jgi:hypothetical protein